MADKTKIQWTDATWNVTVGCAKVSPGCDNCYAIRQAVRHDRPGTAYEGTTVHVPAGVPSVEHGPSIDWSGLVRALPDRLEQPRRWRRPRRIFVDSMSDLFHADVPREFIAKVFAVMALAPQHQFQILTKRPGRMRLLLADERFAREVRTLVEGPAHTPRKPWQHAKAGRGIAPLDIRAWMLRRWPLPNVWLGVSVENQHYADTRIPELLDTPAAVRFLSCEPLLASLNLRRHLREPCACTDENGIARFGIGAEGFCVECATPRDYASPGRRTIDWCIVGGESGPGARPFALQWARSIIDQCRAAGTPTFVKQLGANVWHNGMSGPGEHLVAHTRTNEQDVIGGRVMFRVRLGDRKGGDSDEWPEDLRVREMPA